MNDVKKDDEFTYNPVKRLNTAVLQTLDSTNLSPTILTVISLLLYLAAGICFALKPLWIGGLIILAGGGFSFLDGQLAKKKGLIGAQNRYFESVADRYSDIFLFAGLLYRYASQNDIYLVFLTSIAMIGALLLSYTSIRREFSGKGVLLGFMERPERLTIIILGALLNHMVSALYIIAIVANIDTIRRMYHIYVLLKKNQKSTS